METADRTDDRRIVSPLDEDDARAAMRLLRTRMGWERIMRMASDLWAEENEAEGVPVDGRSTVVRIADVPDPGQVRADAGDVAVPDGEGPVRRRSRKGSRNAEAVRRRAARRKPSVDGGRVGP